MAMNLEKRLSLLEKYHKRILSTYSETLTRTIEIIYEVKANVEWVKIEKFSHDSNFAYIRGNAVVPKGSTLKDRVLDEDMDFMIAVTIQISMLEDGSTPYQIAEAVHRLNMIKQIMGDQFSELLKDPKFTIEKLNEFVKEPDVEHVHIPTNTKSKIVEDEELLGFDLSGLTEQQIQSLKLHQMRIKDGS